MSRSELYYYQFAPKLGDSTLMSKLGEAASTLNEKLIGLDLGSIGISDYNQRYFGSILRGLPSALECETHLLLHALAGHPKSLEDFTLVDYGGGSGIFSLLAKQLGLGRVIYTDIYDVSCRDAQILGKHLGIPANDYLCGDIEQLLAQQSQELFKVDAVVSFNVIEHIYDLPAFFERLATNLGKTCSVVMASSANTLNLRTRYLTMKLQRNLEFNDRSRKWGHKNRDSLRAFLTIRKEIIARHFPKLPMQDVELLARRTRGMMESDILKAVKTYEATGEMPRELDHPTNTCDPMTGNWSEHLLDPYELLDTLEAHGLNGQVLPGYYSRKGSYCKRLVTRMLNILMSQASTLGLRFAPHYMICARNF